MKNISPEILYEDADIVVINKPAGLVVHADGRTEEPTLAGWFAKKYPNSKHVGEPIKLKAPSSKLEAVIERPGIVHRIDRETSGALILAKTAEAHEALKQQFKNLEVSKVYHAFVHGNVKDDMGVIDLPIGRSVGDFRKWSAQRGARGEKRDAVTFYKVLSRSSDKSWTLVEAKPKTGRTHQIRVHFQALHHPVVGDSLYAPSKPKLLGFERLALHARSLTFNKLDGEQITVEAPYPDDFISAIASMG